MVWRQTRAGVGTFWLGLIWWKRARLFRQARLANLRADLQNGVVVEETLTVTGIERLREPEHGMVLVFLRMSQGKAFVLHDETGALALREAFHLVTFPVSARRSWRFSGAPLPLPPVQEMQAPRERWPEDESRCGVRWEKIDSQFDARV